ncbi:MAG: MoaD/ThiS family protein [Deltaproteobacteria bacterium]|nr:MoaD/ThiS family protein [Deltaproteobacteria bacterium]
MGVRINIHKTHRQYTDGVETVRVEGRNVGECLENLVKKHPQMKEALFDGKGRLHNYVEIYVNMESAYPEELAKPVKDGDEIHITVMLAGG